MKLVLRGKMEWDRSRIAIWRDRNDFGNFINTYRRESVGLQAGSKWGEVFEDSRRF